MSNYSFSEEDVFSPVDVGGFSLQTEATASFTLDSSGLAGTAFDLAAAQITGDTATFNLTPAGPDGMTFSLTPAGEDSNLTPEGQTVPQLSLTEEINGLDYDLVQSTAATLLQPDIGVSPVYSRQLNSTISAMTFSPPIQVNSSGNLTPDFTGLLPPPPPSHLERGSSRPPPLLVAAELPPPSYSRGGTSPRGQLLSQDQGPYRGRISPRGGRHLLSQDQGPYLVPGQHFVNPLSNQGQQPNAEQTPPPVQQKTPPLTHQIAGHTMVAGLELSPRHETIATEHPSPQLYSLPHQTSNNKPSRGKQPLQPEMFVSSENQSNLSLQNTSKSSGEQSPQTKETHFPPQTVGQIIPHTGISSLPPPMETSHQIRPTFQKSPQPPPLQMIGQSPPAALSAQKSPIHCPPPPRSPQFSPPNRSPRFSPAGSISPQLSPGSHHPPPLGSHLPPPPPYKSPPPYHHPYHQTLLSPPTPSSVPLNLSITPSAPQPPLPQHPPQSQLTATCPPKTAFIAPNVTLTKKPKPATITSPSPLASPPPVPKSSLADLQSSQSTSVPQQSLGPTYLSTAQTTAPAITSPPGSKSPHRPIPSSPAPPLSSAAKLPSYSLEELKDLPGVNLKKSTVDLNTFVNSVARNRHPNFANIDGYAERCLACIVRKIRSNLPTLKALEAISLFSVQPIDPGCVLIPRMKDGRITIARPGGGTGGTKKIHPHLALVQIFKNPAVVNHNTLVSVPHCSAPFVARTEGGEGEMVCISPLHYTIESTGRAKATPTPKKKAPVVQSGVGEALTSRPIVQETPRAVHVQGIGGGGESDYFSDDSDDDTDWVKKWNEESVESSVFGVQEINTEEVLKQVHYMSLKVEPGVESRLKEAEEKTIDKLRLREDLRLLLNGKYNLEDFQKVQMKKNKAGKPQESKISKSGSNSNSKRNPKPIKKRILGEAWFSEPRAKPIIEQKVPTKPNISSVPIKTEITGANVSIKQEEPTPVEIEIKRESTKDEAVIQNLLDDIKGSFETPFEMDLEQFGHPAAQTFSAQDFSMTNAFSMASFDDISKDSYSAEESSTSRDMFERQPSSVPNDQEMAVVDVPSSDAMFGVPGGLVDLPDIVEGWGVGAGNTAEQGRNQQHQHFSPVDFLNPGPISQDQFLNMFEEDSV